MFIKNLRFVFTFCFGLSSLLAISGSEGEESSQHSQVWMAVNHQSYQERAGSVYNIQSLYQNYLGVAKQFLRSEIKMLEELSIGTTYITPHVIVDLSPIIPKVSKIKEPQSGEVIKPTVPSEKIVSAPEPTPMLIGPNSALGPQNLSLVKLKKDASLKQKVSLKREKPALGPLKVK